MIKRLLSSTAREVHLVVDGQRLTVKRKEDSRLMRVLGRVMGERFRRYFWTTISSTTTWAPSSVDLDRLGAREAEEHGEHEVVLRHEATHARQAKKWPGWYQVSYLLLPLPVLFAYFRFRWEREAMLVDIHSQTKTIEEVIHVLWHSYGWCWPRPWMRRWFTKRLA